MQQIRQIVLIGAGKVGIQLGTILKRKGLEVLQVCSRNEANARSLAKQLNSEFTTDVSALNPDGDLYILTVSDAAIEKVLDPEVFQGKFVVHTSGSVPMNVLDSVCPDYGVLYPLQTFSSDRELDFERIPMCIEANSRINLERLEDLAQRISSTVRRIDTKERKILHLAAVFACNFPNFMYIQAEKILARSGLDFDLLKPLILETAQKVQEMDPVHAQTGPAIRGDEAILQAHLELLKNQPDLQKFYRGISQSIYKLNKNPND
jgi:predicted short-subunit dehydrogenase-like oxidoreductase (DUF2520 family)